MTLRSLLKQLNNWLFEPTSPTPIALVRILIGLIVLQNLVVHLLPDFSLYFGDHPLITLSSSAVKYWAHSPFFDLMVILPDHERWRLAFFLTLVVATIFMIFGLFSRVSMIAVFLGLLSLDNHFELNQNDGDVFLRLSCMILAFSNAGDAFSLDNLIRAFREDWRVTGFAPKLSAPWAQRWYQLQLTFVYCHTFFAKLSGKHWVDGWAVYFASRYDDCQRFMLPIIYDNPFTVKLLSWYTLVIEFLLWTFVWFRDTRYWILLGGLFLHFGIETTMNLPLFEWIFMSSYLAFVYPEDLTRVMDVIKVKVHKYFGEPVILAFDGHDGSAVCAAGVLHRMDIFGFMNLIDFRGQEFASRSSELDGAVHRLYLENKEGWLTSFVALQWMALRLPLLWFLLAFLYIPPLSWLGRIACDWLVRKTRTTIADEQLTPISQ